MNSELIKSAPASEQKATCKFERPQMDTMLEDGEQVSVSGAAGEELFLFSDAPSILLREVSQSLREHGFFLQEFCGLTAALDIVSPPAVVLSVSTGDICALEQHRLSEHAATRYGCSWIPVDFIRSRFLLVGPMFSMMNKPCSGCVRICADAWLDTLMPQIIEPNPLDLSRAACAAALISDAVLAHFGSSRDACGLVFDPTTILYDLQECSSTSLLVGRIPGCAVCWPVRNPRVPTESRRIFLPALFEENSRSQGTKDTSPGFLVPRRLTQDPRASQARVYPNSPKVSLPAWSSLYRNRRICANGEFRLQEIAELLFLTFGRWNAANLRHPDRVLPSAGNLGSPAAFILVRKVDGLEPGAYFYIETSHALAWVASDSMESLDDLFAGLHSTSSAPPEALFVITGDYARISVKYGAFAYRLTHFDCGLSVAHLRSVARCFSLTIHEMSSWPNGGLEDMLGINGEKTPIMEVIGFSAGDKLAMHSRNSLVKESTIDRCGETSLPSREVSAYALAQKINDLSRRDSGLAWNRIHVQSAPSAIHSEPSEAFSLNREDLWSLSITRQSVRLYADKSVDARVAEIILRRAESIARLLGTKQLVKTLATRRIGSDAEPSWVTHELSREGRMLNYGFQHVSGPLDGLFVHKHSARAPLFFWLCGDVMREAWEYRRMLIEAGKQAYHIIQEASCFGLQGHLVGGIWPDKVATVLGLQFCDESPLLAYACGLPDFYRQGE